MRAGSRPQSHSRTSVPGVSSHSAAEAVSANRPSSTASGAKFSASLDVYKRQDAACLAKAKKKKALERCFEQPVPAEVYDALAQQLAGVEVEKEADRDGKEA